MGKGRAVPEIASSVGHREPYAHCQYRIAHRRALRPYRTWHRRAVASGADLTLAAAPAHACLGLEFQHPTRSCKPAGVSSLPPARPSAHRSHASLAGLHPLPPGRPRVAPGTPRTPRNTRQETAFKYNLYQGCVLAFAFAVYQAPRLPRSAFAMAPSGSARGYAKQEDGLIAAPRDRATAWEQKAKSITAHHDGHSALRTGSAGTARCKTLQWEFQEAKQWEFQANNG
eukprot:2242992-Rhodomonas_salina.3